MSSIMKYKGYWAEVKYSDEDECCWGEIEGLKKDLILFEGNTVKELKKRLKNCDFWDFSLTLSVEFTYSKRYG